MNLFEQIFGKNESRNRIDEIFSLIDNTNSIEKLSEMEDQYDTEKILNLFWENRETFLNSEDKLVKTKASLKCKAIESHYSASIPLRKGINPFAAPNGFVGININPESKIGEGCTIFQNVVIDGQTFIDEGNHGFPTIGNCVFIEPGAVIIGNVHIGNNVRIGANCVVKQDVPENSVVLPESIGVTRSETPINNQYIPTNSYKKMMKKRIQTITEEQSQKIYDRIEMNTEYGTLIMGPMNGPEDKHPATIIKSCYLLGVPLPKSAKCGKQPSEYIEDSVFDGHLDTILDVLGDNAPKLEDSRIEKLYTNFKEKYQAQECLSFNNTDLAIYFTDYMLFAKPRACTTDNYFDYEFYNKETEIRDTFLKSTDLKGLWALNDSVHKYFRNKVLFNQTFAHLLKRDWCDCATCSFDEFKAFAKKHETFFAKPTMGLQGLGARIIDTKTDTLKNIFKMCRREGILAEEIVQQHEELSRVNSSTVNTIRVITMLDTKGQPHVMAAAGRFGRKGFVIDNFHGGGVSVVIDEKTGKVISQSIDKNHHRGLIHPDSEVVLLGFQYPVWDKVIDLAHKAALTVPEAKHIGWDICITKDGDVDLIEGNDHSAYYLMQAPDQIGRKPLYKELVPELEKELGITIFKKRKPIIIDVTQYERP